MISEPVMITQKKVVALKYNSWEILSSEFAHDTTLVTPRLFKDFKIKVNRFFLQAITAIVFDLKKFQIEENAD